MATISVQTDDNIFKFGTQSLKITTGSTGNNAVFPADPVAVTPGESRSFSCYVRTNGALTGTVYLRIAQAGLLTPVLAQSGGLLNSSLAAGVDANGWVRQIVSIVIPAGVFTIRPFIQYVPGAANEIFWVDGVKFERGAVASEWQENIVSPRAVVDQSGFQVDASFGGIVRYRGSAGGARDTVSLGANGLVWGGDSEVSSPNTGELKLLPTAGQDKTMTVETASAHLARLKVQVTGDTTARAILAGDATVTGLLLGPGNAASDVRVSRTAAKQVTVDDSGGGAADFLSLGAIRAGLVSLAAGAATEGFEKWDDTVHGLYAGDSVRFKPITPVGWLPYALPLGYQQGDALSVNTVVAANGGTWLQPIFVSAPMVLHSVKVRSADTATARTWGWDLYVDRLNNTSTINRIAQSSANETFTPAAASTREITALSAVVLPPGLYWLAIQNRHATSTFALARGSAGAGLAHDSNGEKLTTNPNGATLDVVTGWSKDTATYAGCALIGRVFGQATGF